MPPLSPLQRSGVNDPVTHPHSGVPGNNAFVWDLASQSAKSLDMLNILFIFHLGDLIRQPLSLICLLPQDLLDHPRYRDIRKSFFLT